MQHKPVRGGYAVREAQWAWHGLQQWHGVREMALDEKRCELLDTFLVRTTTSTKQLFVAARGCGRLAKEEASCAASTDDANALRLTRRCFRHLTLSYLCYQHRTVLKRQARPDRACIVIGVASEKFKNWMTTWTFQWNPQNCTFPPITN